MSKASSQQFLPWFVAVLLAFGAGYSADAERYQARDSLAPFADQSDDARECLTGLVWEPGDFVIENHDGSEDDSFDKLIRFQSPIRSGDPTNDRVALAWYIARDEQGNPRTAPAVIVVHESGRSMPAGRLFARGLQTKGIHAFLIRLPYYGERRGEKDRSRTNMQVAFRQGIADVRRARDVVAALPHVAPENISVQGTSLGGFVAALAGSLDGAFAHTFIVMAGGDLFDMIMHGERDTAKLRRSLLEQGLTNEELRAIFWPVEPIRLAHRLDANRTWLYSATSDQVIPARNALALAKAARLVGEHHQWLPGDHYTMAIYFPKVVDHIARQITADQARTPP
jgi:dienelactone hydrolase